MKKAAGGMLPFLLTIKVTEDTKRWKSWKVNSPRSTLTASVNESFETLGVQLNPIGDDTAVFKDMQKWANESFETLGVQLNPIGDDTAIFNAMQKWTKNWSQQIKKSTLKDHEAHTAMNITIMKKLEYPLVAVTLARKQCDKIMSTLLTLSLSKAG
jgi:hypothetical protein